MKVSSIHDPIADIDSFVLHSENYATISPQLKASEHWIMAEPTKGFVENGLCLFLWV